ncbi:hypothetical protein INR49_005129 [Caranx melampygus]|nr:hypothetical protein INR49_005129 [Caranx melampygus]
MKQKQLVGPELLFCHGRCSFCCRCSCYSRSHQEVTENTKKKEKHRSGCMQLESGHLMELKQY